MTEAALHWAASCDEVAVARVLLNDNATDGESPLCLVRSVAMIERLRSRGATRELANGNLIGQHSAAKFVRDPT